MSRNYGLDKKSHTLQTIEEIAMQNRLEFWTGFFIGGVSASATLLLLICLVAYNLPTV